MKKNKKTKNLRPIQPLTYRLKSHAAHFICLLKLVVFRTLKTEWLHLSLFAHKLLDTTPNHPIYVWKPRVDVTRMKPQQLANYDCLRYPYFINTFWATI